MSSLQMYFSHVHHLHLGANHISVSIPDNVYPLVFQNFSISYLMNTSYDTDKNSYLSPKTNSPAILREYDTFFCFVSCNTFESPLTARRSNQSILKEINPKYLLEGLMLKLKLQCFGHLMRRADSLKIRPLFWGRLKAVEEGDDKGWDGCMASSTQWLWVWASSRDSEGQGKLVYCSPWGWKSQTWLSN